MKVRRAFSLVELLICMLIMAIMASTVMLSMDANKQTAKKEAEKLAAYLHDLMRKSDRTHKAFKIENDSNGISWLWDGDSDSIMSNYNPIYCTNKNSSSLYSRSLIKDTAFTVTLSKSSIKYTPNDNQFNAGGHFTIKRKDDNDDPAYKVFIYIEGRVRVEKS